MGVTVAEEITITEFEYDGMIYRLVDPLDLMVVQTSDATYEIATQWPDIAGWGETREEAIASLHESFVTTYEELVALEGSDMTREMRKLLRDIEDAIEVGSRL